MGKKNNYESILFKPIEANSYYVVEHDGRRIEQEYTDTDEEDVRYYFHDGGVSTFELTKPGDGGTKTYYRKVDKPIKGVAVGCRDIVVKAKLFLGERRDEDGNTLDRFVGKEPEEVVKAVLVYYANMKKRWVPLSDIVGYQMNGEQLCMECAKPVQKNEGEENPYIIVKKKDLEDLLPAGFAALSDEDIPF